MNIFENFQRITERFSKGNVREIPDGNVDRLFKQITKEISEGSSKGISSTISDGFANEVLQKLLKIFAKRLQIMPDEISKKNVD